MLPNQYNIEDLRKKRQEHFQPQVSNSDSEDEESLLNQAIALSLGFEPKQNITEEELEKYLSEKRLDLKKYFVFNIQELTTEKFVDGGNTFYNARGIKDSLADDLTKLAISHGWDNKVVDGEERVKKNILALNRENWSFPSKWESNDLDKKITDGEQSYIIFHKDDNWVNWKGAVYNILESTIICARIKPSLYLKSKESALEFLGENDPLLIERLGEKKSLQKWQEEGKITEEERKVFHHLGIEDEDTLRLPGIREIIDNIEEIREEKIVVAPCCQLQLELELGRAKQRKNLFYWWSIKAVNNEQKLRLEKIGVDGRPDSPEEYELADLGKMLDCEYVAREGSSQSFINNSRLINFFSTWFNQGCALVVCKRFWNPFTSNLFNIYLVIYEPPCQQTGGIFYSKAIGLSTSLEKASKRIIPSFIRSLNGNNPIYTISDDFLFGICKVALGMNLQAVTMIDNLPSEVKSNPEKYIKPLDIVAAKDSFWYSHVGIYLGKDKNGNHKIAQVTREGNRAEITDWENLYNTYKNPSFYLFHAIVPYKQVKLIKEHIAKAVSSEDYDGSYGLLFGSSDYKKGNCQHFANRCVLGINVSFAKEWWATGTQFKIKRKLSEEMKLTNQHFNSLTMKNDKLLSDNRRNVNEYTAQIVHNPPKVWKPEWSRPIEIKPREDCKIQ